MPVEATDETVPRPLLGIASEHLTTDIPRAGPDERVGDVRDRITGRSFTSAADLAVCVRDELVGLVTIEALLAAPAGARIGDVMDTTPPVVAPGDDQELAAWRMVQENESSLAVIDGDGRFVGLIPPFRMLAVLLEEHDEDISRLGGVLHERRQARLASLESVRRRFWHRLPWLLVGLAGALVAAVIVGSFEDDLAKTATLAFFLPGVVYMADAVGTQTEALVIRGLSVGVSIREVLVREIVTGGLIGIVISVLFVPASLLIWGEADVALAVGLALFAACSTATAVAILLPWALSCLGRDPAFGSGPLATVVQDLLSILMYFLIASAIV